MQPSNSPPPLRPSDSARARPRSRRSLLRDLRQTLFHGLGFWNRRSRRKRQRSAGLESAGSSPGPSATAIGFAKPGRSAVSASSSTPPPSPTPSSESSVSSASSSVNPGVDSTVSSNANVTVNPSAIATLSNLTSFWGSLLFYTAIPLPSRGASVQRIARFAPVVGVLLGVGLIGLDFGLAYGGIPTAPRSALVVVVWLALTGGLHLDGAMDTADGLGVTDPQRRLQVMADSRSGAFGVMVAIAILLLKFAALVSITLAAKRMLILLLAPGWGRWGQVWAIARYPYLKPQGKGAMHKADFKAPWDWLLGLVVMLGVAGVFLQWHPYLWRETLGLSLGGFAIALLSGVWFNARFGGQTGDTYGAIVEWTEALLLCLASGL